jgi:hypothetical protein
VAEHHVIALQQLGQMPGVPKVDRTRASRDFLRNIVKRGMLRVFAGGRIEFRLIEKTIGLPSSAVSLDDQGTEDA